MLYFMTRGNEEYQWHVGEKVPTAVVNYPGDVVEIQADGDERDFIKKICPEIDAQLTGKQCVWYRGSTAHYVLSAIISHHPTHNAPKENTMITAEAAKNATRNVISDVLQREKELLDKKIKDAISGGKFYLTIEAPESLIEEQLVNELKTIGYAVELIDDKNERTMTIGWE